jgi:hypothetical protein
MGSLKGSLQPKRPGQKAIPHSLELVIQQTLRLWRKHHLGYDQTRYVVEGARRHLGLEPSAPGSAPCPAWTKVKSNAWFRPPIATGANTGS